MGKFKEVIIERAVKANEVNPNRFYTEGLEEKIQEFINIHRNNYGVSMYKEPYSTTDLFQTNIKLMVGEVLWFNDTSVCIKIYEDNQYYNDIINNSDLYSILFSYNGRIIDNKFKNGLRVYEVSYILKIEIKRKGIII